MLHSHDFTVTTTRKHAAALEPESTFLYTILELTPTYFNREKDTKLGWVASPGF